MGSDGPVPQDAQAFIAALDEVDLSRFRVVGTYTRYDEAIPIGATSPRVLETSRFPGISGTSTRR
jgi:hypothetical protein